MKSLARFPENFQPLVVITGDRREVPPQSKGDMLAYSVSITDIMYIHLHRLENALILSDKMFVVEPEEQLRKRFGQTNILVIGSPAVNLLARRINGKSIFRFAISEQTLESLDEQNEFMERFIQNEDDLFIYQQCLDGIIDIDRVLDRFLGLEPKIAELRERAKEIVPEFMKTKICSDLRTHPRPIRYLMHRLDKPGIYDSLANANRGESIPAYKDYGLISLVKNPFSKDNEDFWIVYVAGVHGPGTALGLKLLTDKNAFKDHPFGGVYEVKIDRFANYFDKFQQSKARWETPPYTENNFGSQDFALNTEKVFLSGPAPKNDEQQKLFTLTLQELLAQIYKDKGHVLEIEGPYTLPLGGEMDFWTSIFDFHKTCHFIIHDLTNCALGVMVEIGFSIGNRKQHFLIWNLKKAPFEAWEKMKRPLLLEAENIEMIDLDDLPKAKSVLESKIVKTAQSRLHSPNCSHCFDVTKLENRSAAFIYGQHKELTAYLQAQLEKHGIYRIIAEDTKADARVCQVCQSLRVANFALIEISETDLDSFIVLGMAKAIGIKTMLFSLDKYHRKDLPWAQEILLYQMDRLEERLASPVVKFLNH